MDKQEAWEEVNDWGTAESICLLDLQERMNVAWELWDRLDRRFDALEQRVEDCKDVGQIHLARINLHKDTLDAMEKRVGARETHDSTAWRGLNAQVYRLEKRMDRIAGVADMLPPREEQAPLPSGVVDAINDNFDDLTQAPTCDTCGEYKTDNWGPFCQHTGIPNATHGDCRWTPKAQPEGDVKSTSMLLAEARELLKRCSGELAIYDVLKRDVDLFLEAE